MVITTIYCYRCPCCPAPRPGPAVAVAFDLVARLGRARLARLGRWGEGYPRRMLFALVSIHGACSGSNVVFVRLHARPPQQPTFLSPKRFENDKRPAFPSAGLHDLSKTVPDLRVPVKNLVLNVPPPPSVGKANNEETWSGCLDRLIPRAPFAVPCCGPTRARACRPTGGCAAPAARPAGWAPAARDPSSRR